MEQTFYFEDPATVKVWRLAICQQCTPILPIPFESATERTEWAEIHARATEHVVKEVTQVRVQSSGQLLAQGPLGMLGP